MNEMTQEASTESFERITAAVVARLAKNQPIRRTLPGNGRLRIDRQLPFLFVYRSTGKPDPGTQQLVMSEAAYLFATWEPEFQAGLNHLCHAIGELLKEHFGTFLLIEIWAEPDLCAEESDLQPAFEVQSSELTSLGATVETFVSSLSEIKVAGNLATVDSRLVDSISPPQVQPLSIATSDAAVISLGLAIRPIYQDRFARTLYPLVLQALRPQLAWAVRKTVAKFTGAEAASSLKLVHYDSLGPSTFVKAARLVDQQLCEVAESFDFLLQVTPTNADQAWHDFKASKFTSEPMFCYRPLPYHPSHLKRTLFDIEIERIEDPTLAHLFWEKQDELDYQLTALRHLDMPQFLHSCLQIYGEVDDSLMTLASEILQTFPEPETEEEVGKFADVKQVVKAARDEIDEYKLGLSEFNAKVEICDDIASGIMVSRGKLLISKSICVPFRRIESLIHHEIGTHLLTYFNGRCQPFQQLYSGLDGYEELQEGLAVLSEYLTDGLTVNRLRVLASRVLAVGMMLEQASFQETFQHLHHVYQFPTRQAFVTAMRVYRGGGFTKDIIYLRGLRDLLKFLSAGHDVEPLYVGKMGLHHLPYIQELRRRGIIQPPGTLPRFWKDTKAQERLELSRKLTTIELLEKRL